METQQTKAKQEKLVCKSKTPSKIQIIKFAIGIVIGISIYLIVQLIF